MLNASGLLDGQDQVLTSAIAACHKTLIRLKYFEKDKTQRKQTDVCDLLPARDATFPTTADPADPIDPAARAHVQIAYTLCTQFCLMRFYSIRIYGLAKWACNPFLRNLFILNSPYSSSFAAFYQRLILVASCDVENFFI